MIDRELAVNNIHNAPRPNHRILDGGNHSWRQGNIAKHNRVRIWSAKGRQAACPFFIALGQ
jgi:hypothetical protein